MHANYHTRPGSYIHQMEIVDGGNMALLAGVGPMGLAAINYVINRKDRKPSLMVVTDIDQNRLDRAISLFPPEKARQNGIRLHYMNTGKQEDAVKSLLQITDGHGYNDVFVFAPVPGVIQQGDSILAFDGCLNFFAGPSDPRFSSPLNFYNVHYNFTHLVGTSGGNKDDMEEALSLMAESLDPAGLVTHIGGLDAVIETTRHLPEIPGGKKLIYTNISMPLTALYDFTEKGKTDPLFGELAVLTGKTNGLWNIEAEKHLMANAKPI
jgi:threonine dehydrogenase-like Zn-dependent dehydrogenase